MLSSWQIFSNISEFVTRSCHMRPTFDIVASCSRVPRVCFATEYIFCIILFHDFFICSTFQIFTPSFSTPKLVFIFCHLRPTFPIIASCSGESAQSRFCFGIFLLFTSLQKCKIFYGLGFFYFHLFYLIISSHFHFLMRPEANL